MATKRITESQKYLHREILRKVLRAMEADTFGEMKMPCFTDGGRFTLMLDGTQYYQMEDLLKKLDAK